MRPEEIYDLIDGEIGWHNSARYTGVHEGGTNQHST